MATQNEQELSLFDLACAKISDAQKLMSEARELLKQDLDNVKEKKSAFEELTKTLNQVHFGSTVKLNVGGKIYKTTLDTLRKDPDSMLCAMFSGRHELKPDEEDRAYFIDRDSELFRILEQAQELLALHMLEECYSHLQDRSQLNTVLLRYILNYLRNGELRCPDDRLFQEDLLSEAKFYQVKGIIEQLDSKDSMANLLELSAIINSECHQSAISSWLPPGATSSLLFRASADGKTPKDFHRCCDNKGPTLVVIQSDRHIFGGYTSKSWESTRADISAIADSESFLYKLVNPSGSEPIKIASIPGKAGAGILSHFEFGPAFGNEKYFDLVVWHRTAPRSVSMSIGYGFATPQNANSRNYLTGSSTSNVTELEVFKIDF